MKRFIFLALNLCLGFVAFSQSNSINYKALIKDGSGNVINNQSITIQFQILQGASLVNVYQETHTPTTDANGIVVLNIGAGNVDSGNYGNIDWGSDDHFLNVQIDTGSGLVDMGTTEFMAVPYALSAKSLSSDAIGINDLSDGRVSSNSTSTFLGFESGANDDGTGFQNIGLGGLTLLSNTSGAGNIAIGYSALLLNTTGNSNTAVGPFTLSNNTTGIRNTAIGLQSLQNSNGNFNTAVGYFTLNNNTTGGDNTALGYRAGFNNVSGNFNVFLGNRSGENELGSNKLYIENSDADADNALIYGEFDTNILRTNGTLQIGNPTATGFAFPTADGTANQILQTDGNGTIVWQDQVVGGATSIDELSDGRVSSSSTFLGFDSGANDDGTLNQNVGVGVSALSSNTSGSQNAAIGNFVLSSNTTGLGNTAVGFLALQNNTTSNVNSAFGLQSLQNATGEANSGFGGYALQNNTTGNQNTAVGHNAGLNNVSGSSNVFLGSRSGENELGSNKLYIENSDADSNNALIYGEFDNDILRTNGTLQIGNPTNTGFAFPTADGAANQILQTDGNGALTWQDVAASGATELNELSDAKYDGTSLFLGVNSGSNNDGAINQNVGVGTASLLNNTTGVNDTAIGFSSLISNTTGSYNTAIGTSALNKNTIGSNNSAFGVAALFNNTEGNDNTAIGRDALLTNTLGSDNISIGNFAMRFNTEGNNNVATGTNALRNNTTGSFNSALGDDALSSNSTGNNNTAIGYNAEVPDGTLDNQVRIGNTSVTYAGVQVAWDITSDRRWKDNIRALPYGLNMVNQLQPVDYIRKNNETKTRETGFIAQDVEQLLKDLGYADQGLLHKDDKGYMSLRYNDFIAILTKAIQEQQEIIESQKGEIDSLTTELSTTKDKQSQIASRLSAIEALLNTAQQ